MRIIPIQDAPAFTETVTLDGTPYVLNLRYNYRGGFWSMGIATPSGTIILAGVKLVGDYPLIGLYENELLPPGELFVLDTTGENRAVDIDTLGVSVHLVYLTGAELESL